MGIHWVASEDYQQHFHFHVEFRKEILFTLTRRLVKEAYLVVFFSYFPKKHTLWGLRKRLIQVLLMSTHNVCFMEKLRKLSQNYHQILLFNKSSAWVFRQTCLRLFHWASMPLIRVFFVCMKKLYILGFPECAQWRFWSDCMCKLIWIFARGTYPKVRFLTVRLI